MWGRYRWQFANYALMTFWGVLMAIVGLLRSSGWWLVSAGVLLTVTGAVNLGAQYRRPGGSAVP
jgi:hypothetical protein